MHVRDISRGLSQLADCSRVQREKAKEPMSPRHVVYEETSMAGQQILPIEGSPFWADAGMRSALHGLGKPPGI
jgi:hypothetical protein